MRDYTHYYPTHDEKIRHKAEKNFEVHYRHGDESYQVKINDDFNKSVIIKAHSNPMRENLEDMKMYFVNDKKHNIHWGDEISGYDDGDGHKYLVITRPESNGVTSKCRIRKMYDKIRFFKDDKCYIYDCIKAKGLLYTATSYSEASEVFTDEDMIAIAIRYDKVTAKLKMFDEIWFDKDVLYKIVRIDNCTTKEQFEEFGVLQITLIRTVFGQLEDNRFKEESFDVTGILRYAQLKERIYNAKSRELLTPHDSVATGDYIVHTFPRNPYINDDKICIHDYTETRRYLVFSLVDMRADYDSCFMVNANVKINLKDDDGNAYPVYAYFDSNATQLMANERNNNMYNQNSKLMFYCQDNPLTHKLGREISRVMIDRPEYDAELLDCYEVVGTDPYTYKGCIRVELNESKINPAVDNLKLRIADYYHDNYTEDTTSDEEFDTLYANPNTWIYLSGWKELLTGETVSFDLTYEPKIVENENHDIKPYNVEFSVTMEDGSPLINGLSYKIVDNSILFTCSDNVSLQGKKIKVVVKAYFEEKYYDETEEEYSIKYHVSELNKEYFVTGW